MFGIKLWFTGPGGWTRCARCRRRVREVASPYWGASMRNDLWCARCLRQTGRTR